MKNRTKYFVSEYRDSFKHNNFNIMSIVTFSWLTKMKQYHPFFLLINQSPPLLVQCNIVFVIIMQFMYNLHSLNRNRAEGSMIQRL